MEDSSVHLCSNTHIEFKSRAAHNITQLVCISGSNDITLRCFVFHSLGGAAKTSTSCLFYTAQYMFMSNMSARSLLTIHHVTYTHLFKNVFSVIIRCM